MNTERYRNHVIFVTTARDLETQLWKTSAHVQFNEARLRFAMSGYRRRLLYLARRKARQAT
jgi:hypothetical protein